MGTSDSSSLRAAPGPAMPLRQSEWAQIPVNTEMTGGVHARTGECTVLVVDLPAGVSTEDAGSRLVGWHCHSLSVPDSGSTVVRLTADGQDPASGH